MRKCSIQIVFVVLFLFISTNSFAFWVWTPETNKWSNPKYSVKGTPAEQLQEGLNFYKTQQYDEAIKEFKKLIKHYPKSRQAPEALYHIGLCLSEKGELFKAFQKYQKVIKKYPFSERSAEIIQKQYEIGLKLLEGSRGKRTVKDKILGNEYNVVDVFKAVIKNAPYGDLAASAQYKIGLYLLEKKLYQEARDEFEKVINDYPESEWIKAAKYQIAITDAQRSTKAQYDQKVTQSAVDEFEDFLEVYPDAELSKKAKGHIQKLRDKEAKNNYVIAQFYEKQKNYKAAKVYYKVVVDDYKQSKWSAKALKKILEMNQKEEKEE